MKYRCILLDPPWLERGGGKSIRGAQRHYPLMKPHQILEAVLQCPLWHPDDEGAHLWLWSTDNYLPDALDLMRGLGFRYIRTMVWAKLAPPRENKLLDLLADSEREFCAIVDDFEAEFRRIQIGLGQYLRGAHEPCLLGVRGRLPAEVRNVPSLILAPRTEHSRKPEAAYRAIEAVSPGPRLELFARRQREGWDVWGDEIS